MWIAFSFASALFAGITAIIAKIGIRNINSTVATALRTVIILIFSWIIVFITGTFQNINDISGKTLLFLILSGLATGGSWLCYFKALQLGDVNKVTPIDKSSTILTMLLAYVILGEELDPKKIICMLLIGAGTYLMITKKQSDKSAEGKGWLIYAVLSAFFASLTSVLGKIGISGIDSNLGTAIRTAVVLIMAWVMVFVTGKQKEIKEITAGGAIFISISGLTTGLSWLCYYKALQDGPASVVVPIDKLSILVTIIFSYFILKERLTLKALSGLALIIVGTLLLVI
ncbi:EamA family transporter [Ruminococcus sp. Marseille-P6503]|uniref:EamA family transporter n=1 Tax=Ruminococcus sp. Marseille-P6503 TaxID=2364796 RepID=UPI000F52BD53|nr:EamA family transporter [Ruminococcus sp. Marseille-P6503]